MMELSERQQRAVDCIRKEAAGEILRIEPGIKGFHVVQQLDDDSEPILYSVTLETRPDGSESLHWATLGTVKESGETNSTK